MAKFLSFIVIRLHMVRRSCWIWRSPGIPWPETCDGLTSMPKNLWLPSHWPQHQTPYQDYFFMPLLTSMNGLSLKRLRVLHKAAFDKHPVIASMWSQLGFMLRRHEIAHPMQLPATYAHIVFRPHAKRHKKHQHHEIISKSLSSAFFEKFWVLVFLIDKHNMCCRQH